MPRYAAQPRNLNRPHATKRENVDVRGGNLKAFQLLQNTFQVNQVLAVRTGTGMIVAHRGEPQNVIACGNAGEQETDGDEDCAYPLHPAAPPLDAPALALSQCIKKHGDERDQAPNYIQDNR